MTPYASVWPWLYGSVWSWRCREGFGFARGFMPLAREGSTRSRLSRLRAPWLSCAAATGPDQLLAAGWADVYVYKGREFNKLDDFEKAARKARRNDRGCLRRGLPPRPLMPAAARQLSQMLA